MGITGGIKFFEDNKARLADGTIITVSSGIGNSCIDENLITRWRSVGSVDTTTETLVIELPSSQAIDRIHLGDFNWKEFTIKYDVAGAPTDFANVVGIDGALGGGISETVFAHNSAYYEFDEVTTSIIYITATKSQVVDAEKYLNKFTATKELGTLVGFPEIKKVEVSKNPKNTRMLSGKNLSESNGEFFNCTIDFKNYPSSLASDIALIFELYRRDFPFIIWICGGREGSDYFGFQMEGYRLQDIYRTNITNVMKPKYSSNVFMNPVNYRATFGEAVSL